LPTAELNGVFYRTPTQEAVKSWRNQTGQDFVFAWKASKFITHWEASIGKLYQQPRIIGRPIILARKQGRPNPFSTAAKLQGLTLTASATSSRCCRTAVATALNSAIRVGTRRES
jgi:hypothetical protein